MESLQGRLEGRGESGDESVLQTAFSGSESSAYEGELVYYPMSRADASASP